VTQTILRIDTSLFGPQGHSSQLNQHLQDQLHAQLGDIQVIHRDLSQAPLPHLDGAFLAALGTPAEARSPAQQAQVALADSLIAELQAAHRVILAAPMYNFAIPSGLKAWMDYVARAGTTFRYTAQGPEGLLGDKPVYIQTTRGGIHQGSPRDSIEPLLTSFFNFLGIRDLRFTFAEGLNMGEQKALGLQAAQAQIAAHLHH
jgi:FMN-dependent NADH-azoreductase